LTTVTTQSPQPDTAAPRPGMAKLVLGTVFLLATALAFTIVLLTNDPSLSPKQRQARGEIRRVDKLFKDFYRMMGRYPSEQEAFTTIIQSGVLEEVPVDPWGRPFQYVVRDRTGHVFSLGEDGLPGGVGEAADIDAGGVEVAAP
jgi:general secretion pathway protein G